MPKAATRENTKSVLIETGISIMLEKGYNATALSEVLTTAGVPKGSFYYYFQSKEDFGLQIINYFDERYVHELDRVLNDTSLTPLERMQKYVTDSIEKAEAHKCSRGCLIANLSQEMADQNELFRARLAQIMQKRSETFARTLREAKDAGQVPQHVCVNMAAEFFLCAFEGALMRSKAMQNTKPLHTVQKMFFGLVLGLGPSGQVRCE
jgi:TetR/AcrR family transcriptional repressor of nem operon